LFKHGFDLLIIDSVNKMNYSPKDIQQIQEKNKALSTIQVFKATKSAILKANRIMHTISPKQPFVSTGLDLSGK